ncbi:hypothetical protein GKODMF_14250 [Candidatus Electrothrix gigas]
MKFLCFYLAIILIIPFQWTVRPALGETSPAKDISVDELKQVKKEAKQTVRLAHAQLKEEIQLGITKRIATALHLLKLAVNNYVAIDSFIDPLSSDEVIDERKNISIAVFQDINSAVTALSNDDDKKFATLLSDIEQLGKKTDGVDTHLKGYSDMYKSLTASIKQASLMTGNTRGAMIRSINFSQLRNDWQQATETGEQVCEYVPVE